MSLCAIGTPAIKGASVKAEVLAPEVKGPKLEIGKLRRADVALAGDLAASLAALHVRPPIRAWRRHCLALKEQHAWRYDAPGEGIYTPDLLRRLSAAADGELILTCDVGQHQMWVAQHCLIRSPERHLSSGGLGAMGYGLPAAIGAHYADPTRTAISVSGDGSIMINIQELATLHRYGLPVKILVIDNQSLGMVRQWQELFFAERYSEIDLSDNPDFVALAQVFGIAATRIDNRDDVEGGLAALLAEPGPALLHVAIDARANVWPLVPPNTANSTMLESNPAHARQETPNAIPA